MLGLVSRAVRGTFFAGSESAVEYLAGYVIEYSLSVDNLFIFVLIRAPAVRQHRVPLIGIVLALIMLGLFIAVSAALISHFS